MVRLLAALAVVWPIVMAGAVGARAGGRDGGIFSAAPFVIGEVICHRRPERSFHTAGVQWPVCGRCTGLYLAAPAGALAALVASRRRRRKPMAPIPLLAIAAVPTAVTFIAEWAGLLPMANLSRFAAALPLGAAVAWLVVDAAGGDRPIG